MKLTKRTFINTVEWESTPLTREDASDVAKMFGHELPRYTDGGPWSFWAEVSFAYRADTNDLLGTETRLCWSHPELGDRNVILSSFYPTSC